MQTNTNNINKTWALLQTTEGKDEQKKKNNLNLMFNLFNVIFIKFNLGF